jgi:hypothetical protein
MEEQRFISLGSAAFSNIIQLNFRLQRVKINGTAVMSVYFNRCAEKFKTKLLYNNFICLQD